MAFHEPDYSPDAFEVKVSEFLVATPDGGDNGIDDAVSEVLRLLREKLQMDVVFVSEFIDGQRVMRLVDAGPQGQAIRPGYSTPLEESFCMRVVDGRMPRLIHDVSRLPQADLPRTPVPVGAHLSTPIVLADGSIYGTLCCFSFAANDELTQRDLKKLEMSAQLAAKKIDAERGSRN